MRLPDPERSWAVFVGIGDYRHLPALRGVHNGAKALRAALVNPRYGSLKPEHCVLVPEAASRREVGQAVRNAASRAEDLLLVYYAGHGLRGLRRHELHLAVADSEQDEVTFTSIKYDDVRDVVLESHARSKVVILDCCYSGRALGQRMSGDTAIIDEIDIEGAATLTSVPPNEPSMVLPGEAYPAYTGRLLRILRDGVPDAPELLNLSVLHRSLHKAIRAAGLRPPQANFDALLDGLGLVRNRASAPATLKQPEKKPERPTEKKAAPPEAKAAPTEEKAAPTEEKAALFEALKEKPAPPKDKPAPLKEETGPPLNSGRPARPTQPNTRTPQPGTATPQAGATTPQPGITTPQAGSTTPHPDTRTPQPGTATPQAGTATPQPDTRTPQPGTTTPPSGQPRPYQVPPAPSPGAWRHSPVGVPVDQPPGPKEQLRSVLTVVAALVFGPLMAFVLTALVHDLMPEADRNDFENKFGDSPGFIVTGVVLIAVAALFVLVTQSGLLRPIKMSIVAFVASSVVGFGMLLAFGFEFQPVAIGSVVTGGYIAFLRALRWYLTRRQGS